MAVAAYCVSIAARVAKIGTASGIVAVSCSLDTVGLNPKKRVGEMMGVRGGSGRGGCPYVASTTAAANEHNIAKAITNSRTKRLLVIEVPLDHINNCAGYRRSEKRLFNQLTVRCFSEGGEGFRHHQWRGWCLLLGVLKGIGTG
jgi:hypothetical protein